MKIKAKRNLLTVILSVLCAVMLCCSVGMIGGAKQKDLKIAKAASTDLYDDAENKFNVDVLKGIATSVGLKDFNDMVNTAISGTIKNATDFGDTTVTFGGLE